MELSSRFTINRHLIIVVPGQPAVDWVNSVEQGPGAVTLAELRDELDAHLVPTSISGRIEAERWVLLNWDVYFESFLEEWYMDQSLWPKKRTKKMFKEWFEVRFHSMVFDLAAGQPIEYEDWGESDDD